MSDPQQPAQPYGSPSTPPPYTPAPPSEASTSPYGGGTAPAYGTPAPAYGTPAPAYGAPAPTAGNPLGRTAFLIAVIAAGLSILFSLITPFLYTSGNYDVAESLSNVIAILSLLVGIAAAVLSIVALRRPAPHLFAAIALGISGSLVVGRVVSWLASLLYYLF